MEFSRAGSVGRQVKAATCAKCKLPTLRGLDHDSVAMAATVDPYPLSALGEALALTTGRETYSLKWIGAKYILDYRTPEHIRGLPAGSDPRMEVLASHSCGAIYTEQMIAAYMQHSPRPQETVSDTPPF